MNISFLGRKAMTKERLVDEICAKLTKQGYKWQIIEGDLMVVKNDNNFRVIFWENSNKTLFRTFFIWYYSDEYLKHFKEWWLDIATCMTNRKNRNTISLLYDEDKFYCRFDGAVCNADDFMEEFEIAYANIMDAVDFFFNYLKQMEEEAEKEDFASESDNTTEFNKKYPWKEPIEEIMERANNGDGESLLRIGICYQFGVYGFEKDKSKAAEFYQDAMKQNNYRAMFNLAALYSNADGVAYNHDKAIELLTRIEKESGNLELSRQAHLAKKQVDNLEQVKYLFT